MERNRITREEGFIDSTKDIIHRVKAILNQNEKEIREIQIDEIVYRLEENFIPFLEDVNNELNDYENFVKHMRFIGNKLDNNTNEYNLGQIQKAIKELEGE